MNAFFEGLDAEYYVKGTAVCASNFKRAEENLSYMNNHLALYRDDESQEAVEGIIFNVTQTITTYMPFTIYFCYSLPEKTEEVWIEHYKNFLNF